MLAARASIAPLARGARRRTSAFVADARDSFEAAEHSAAVLCGQVGRVELLEVERGQPCADIAAEEEHEGLLRREATQLRTHAHLDVGILLTPCPECSGIAD